MANFREAKDLMPGWTVGLGSPEKNTYEVVKLSDVKVSGTTVSLDGISSKGNYQGELGKFDRIPVLSMETIAPLAESPANTGNLSRQLVDAFLDALENHPEGQQRLREILKADSPADS